MHKYKEYKRGFLHGVVVQNSLPSLVDITGWVPIILKPAFWCGEKNGPVKKNFLYLYSCRKRNIDAVVDVSSCYYLC